MLHSVRFVPIVQAGEVRTRSIDAFFAKKASHRVFCIDLFIIVFSSKIDKNNNKNHSKYQWVILIIIIAIDLQLTGPQPLQLLQKWILILAVVTWGHKSNRNPPPLLHRTKNRCPFMTEIQPAPRPAESLTTPWLTGNYHKSCAMIPRFMSDVLWLSPLYHSME